MYSTKKGLEFGMGKRRYSLKNRLYMLLFVSLVPLTILITYLMVMTNSVSAQYDEIVEKITKANQYNINFKDDLDYSMYIIVVNAERANDIIDTNKPVQMIDEACGVFKTLSKEADTEAARMRLSSIIKSLNTLRDRVTEIEESALTSGSYETNMERLDLNIRVLTELIQEEVQFYIYEQTRNMETLKEGIRGRVEKAISITGILLIFILIGSLTISHKIVEGITSPIRHLCNAAKRAGQGDFETRTHEERIDEIAVLSTSFNQMVEEIGKLVEDIRVEELNLRAAELRLLQEQINPHFLYNTLDNIIWLAESKETEQVVGMVSALSDFFRTTLSKGKDFISVRDEETHINSYLQIQQFRYRDILTYEIDMDEEVYDCEILKLTLQPLVENALYHGIKGKRGLGHIQVTGCIRDGLLEFQVQDNGIGMKEERLNEVRRIITGEAENTKEKGGFGLFNVNERIRLKYGREYGLRIESTYGKGTCIWVTVPAVKK